MLRCTKNKKRLPKHRCGLLRLFIQKQGLFHAGFLLGLAFEPEDERDLPPKRQFTFSGLHGVISQKTEILEYEISLR
jgi:hypothetical protein